jgi:hypothetical protein
MKISFTIFMTIILLTHPSLSVEINCKCENFKKDHVVTLEWECKNFVLTDENDNDVNLKIDNRLNCKNKEPLKILQATMKFLPSQIVGNFTHIEELVITDVKFVRLTANTLKSFKNLKILRILNNSITEIPADTFKHNPNLTLIALKNNKIKHIDHDVFSHLKQLKDLRLNGNDCINATFNFSSHHRELFLDEISRQCSNPTNWSVILNMIQAFIIVALIIGLFYCSLTRQVESPRAVVMTEMSYAAPKDVNIYNEDENVYDEPVGCNRRFSFDGMDMGSSGGVYYN